MKRRPQRNPRTLYVSNSPGASDSHDGLHQRRPWRSIQRVNREQLYPGDAVLFRGGDEFAGTIRFMRGSAGTARRPILISSYGRGNAIIAAGAGSGIVGLNASGICIRNLVIRGGGTRSNHGSGVSFVNALRGDVSLPHLRIEQVQVSGFGRFGILISGRYGKSGFRDVRITDSELYDNRISGIEVRGRFSCTATTYAHHRLYIAHCDVHDNHGYARSSRHVGNGIVISDVNEAMIELCRAWSNGTRNTCRDGPVGIWAWDANQVVIQYCESHHNRTCGPSDGGGFDLDGGVTNSVLQYNLSHHNDGAGFGIYQFRGARPMHGNIVRRNISVNDGRRNGYGGIQLMNWGSGIRDIRIEANTIYVAPVASHERQTQPSAVRFKSTTADVRICNNLFVVGPRVPLIRARGVQSGISFQDNACRVDGTPRRIHHSGRTYDSVEAWLEAIGALRQPQHRPAIDMNFTKPHGPIGRTAGSGELGCVNGILP